MQASNLFNGYIGSHLCYHLGKTGVLELFTNNENVNLRTIHNSLLAESHPEWADTLITFGIKCGIFRRQREDQLALTQLGQDIKKNIGFFIWAVGGYGELFRKYPYPIAAEGEGCHAFVDGGNVAQGSRLANQSFMWDIITTEFRRHTVKCVADLGSGNAGALISLCKVFPEATGIGIDVSAKAIDDAQRNILRHGLQDRIRLYNQNVLQAVEDPVLQQRFAQADTLMTFMMMHDLFNIEDPIWVLQKLRSTFPNVRKFLIADTFISEEQSLSDESPMFVYGFEYVHSLMKIKLFKKSDYENYFAAAGFNIMATHYLNVPYTYLFFCNESDMEQQKAYCQLPIFHHVTGHHQPVPYFLTSNMFGGLPFERVISKSGVWRSGYVPL